MAQQPTLDKRRFKFLIKLYYPYPPIHPEYEMIVGAIDSEHANLLFKIFAENLKLQMPLQMPLIAPPREIDKDGNYID